MASEIKVGDRVRVRDTTKERGFVGKVGRVAYFSSIIHGLPMVMLDDFPGVPVSFAVENLEPIPGPLTPEEAQAAYDAATPVPLSKERVEEIVRYATGKHPAPGVTP